MNFLFINILYLCITLLNAQTFEIYDQIDCESIVTSGFVSYKGCSYLIPTDSLRDNRNESKKIIHVFKGIPYAKPPIDELRFRRTEPLPSPTEPTVLDCQYYSSACMQPIHTSGRTAEDCLYLNVWTPTVDPSAALAVMVFIHGGGFHIGSGHQYFVDTFSVSNVFGGSLLALRDVVVVNFNYRLGIWGFLYGNSSDCPGNMGFWDQSMALNWTRHHIRAFGGDPEQLTLFGESAGSISISNHIVSNVTRNWFQRAIMQSGTGYNKLWSRDPDYSYGIARRFASDPDLFPNTTCADDNTWIECLRNKTSAELLSAQSKSIFWEPRDPWNTVGLSSPFRPVFGDQFIPISVNRAVKTGNFRKDIHIILGHNEMEGALVTTLLDLFVGLRGRYLPFIPRPLIISKRLVFKDIKNVFIENKTIAEEIARSYTNPFNRLLVQINPSSIRKSAVHMFGDYSLTCPTVLFGANMVKSRDFEGKVYQYRLTYGSTQSISSYSTWADVSHTDELPLVFGQPFKPFEQMLWNRNDRKLSQQVMDIWTHFAKYGTVPEINGNVWPEYAIDGNNRVNVKYIEFHANQELMAKVHENAYNGSDPELYPKVVNNCLNFWDKIFSQQF